MLRTASATMLFGICVWGRMSTAFIYGPPAAVGQSVNSFLPNCNVEEFTQFRPTRIVRQAIRRASRLSSILHDDSSSDEVENSELKQTYDVERYRNRSVLLENALQHKLNALKLSDQKLLVLQDAAKRVLRRHESELAAVAHAKSAKENSEYVKANLVEERVRDAVKQVEFKFQKKLESVTAERSDATKQLETSLLLQEQASKESDYLRTKLSKLQTLHEQDKAAWKAESQLLEQQLAREHERYEAAASGIAQLERTTEKLEAELFAVNSKVDQLQTALQKEKHRSSSFNDKFVALAEAKERLEVKLDELLQENSSLTAEAASAAELSTRITASVDAVAAFQPQQDYEERMEIAQSAVTAAVRSEQMVRENYDALQQNYEALIQEKQALEQQLAQQQQQPKPTFVTVKKSIEGQPSLDGLDTHVHGKLPSETITGPSPSIGLELEQSNTDEQLIDGEVLLESLEDVSIVEHALPAFNPSKTVTVAAHDAIPLTQPHDASEARRPMGKQLRALMATLQPGRMGDFFQKRHLTFEDDPSSSKWRRFVKRLLLPRIPFRIVRTTNNEE